MSENRKCVNCRHNIRKEKPSGNIECVCEITNKHIGYVECFEGWCRHWGKQKPLTDDELAKIKFEDLIPLAITQKIKRSKIMSKLQVKIDGEWKDFMDCDIVKDLEKDFERLKKTSEKGKEIAYTRNLIMLANGEFGIDTNSPKTLLAYWQAQYLAGYPCAEENVKYFEEMVRKENGNAENQG